MSGVWRVENHILIFQGHMGKLASHPTLSFQLHLEEETLESNKTSLNEAQRATKTLKMVRKYNRPPELGLPLSHFPLFLPSFSWSG